MVKYADIWLRQKPGTDVAVFNGLMNVIISEDLYAKEYVAERTEGFDALKAAVEKYTPEYVEKISGIPAEDLKKAAGMYAKAKRASIIYAMGITQHISGTDNVKTMRQSVHALRQCRHRRRRRKSSARSEQCSGRLRYGRTAQCFPGLSAGGQ